MAVNEIACFLQNCINRKVFPGAAAGISCRSVRTFICAGNLTDESESPVVSSDTIFDLASLTKPIATTTAILKLVQDGRVNLDQPVSGILEEFAQNADKKDVTIRSLLTHTSGFAAWEPMYIHASSRAEIVRHLASKPLRYPTGSEVEYSCLGFIVLAEIISKISGESLASFCKRYIFNPLHLTDTMFCPSKSLKDRIAPTELGNSHEQRLCEKAGVRFDGWRRHRLQGEVHDGNAWISSGEGGNAGLFSSAEDVVQFGEYCLKIIHGEKSLVLSHPLMVLATCNQTGQLSSHRGLGWQMADSSSAVSGILPSEAFGHNGFTGTSLWIDPQSDSVFVLLTNRVYYSDSADPFNSIRRRFHQLVIEEH